MTDSMVALRQSDGQHRYRALADGLLVSFLAALAVGWEQIIQGQEPCPSHRTTL